MGVSSLETPTTSNSREKWRAAPKSLPLSSLILEVTESRVMRDRRAALEVLVRLRFHRISLSIDDFGTGYSSLAQLRDFPFNELKIDRGFVHNACITPVLRAITGASVRMGRELGMRIVAEGVEDRQDWDHIRGMDADLAKARQSVISRKQEICSLGSAYRSNEEVFPVGNTSAMFGPGCGSRSLVAGGESRSRVIWTLDVARGLRLFQP